MWHSPRESRGLSASGNVGPADGGNYGPETLGSTSVGRKPAFNFGGLIESWSGFVVVFLLILEWFPDSSQLENCIVIEGFSGQMSKVK